MYIKGVLPTISNFFIFDLFQAIMFFMGQVPLKYENHFLKFKISIFSGGREPKIDQI